jgi:flagellar basal-body rod protein FlgB
MPNLLKLEYVDALSTGLQGAEQRQRAIAQNLANINTPGYKRWEVGFDRAVQQALEGSNSADPAGRTREISWSRDNSTSNRPDGNNVDLDAELALMSENSLYQRTLVRLLSGKLQRLKTAIRRGGE